MVSKRNATPQRIISSHVVEGNVLLGTVSFMGIILYQINIELNMVLSLFDDAMCNNSKKACQRGKSLMKINRQDSIKGRDI